MRYCRIFAKAGLKLSRYIVAIQESINRRFGPEFKVKLIFSLKGGHLLRPGSIINVVTAENVFRTQNSESLFAALYGIAFCKYSKANVHNTTNNKRMWERKTIC